MGAQVIDLEGLARHRGSLLGGMGGQPSQKAFETALAMEVAALDPARPVVIEAESSKVGDLIVPPTVWKAMIGAERVEVAAPVAARAEYLARAYADLTADAGVLAATLGTLRPMQGAERVAAWQGLGGCGAVRGAGGGAVRGALRSALCAAPGAVGAGAGGAGGGRAARRGAGWRRWPRACSARCDERRAFGDGADAGGAVAFLFKGFEDGVRVVRRRRRRGGRRRSAGRRGAP